MSLLTLQHISTGYDKKQVLYDVSLEINAGEAVLLVGSNGSGKSTLFKAIYGLLDVWEGTVSYDGETLHGPQSKAPSPKLIGKGMMYIPQKNELFEDMTVLENLRMGVLHLNDKREIRRRLDEVFDQIPVLKDKQKQTTHRLSGGERKLLSLGMVLANRPKLLLYDEPLAGLSGSNVNLVLQWLQYLKNNGTTLVLVEHRIKELITFTDRVIGLKLGRLSSERLNNIETIKKFLV